MANENTDIQLQIAEESQMRCAEPSLSRAIRGEVVLYQPDNSISLEVKLDSDTVWLSQAQLCQLFGKVKSTISYHISKIFKEGELDKKVVIRKIRTTTPHGAIKGKTQDDELTLYNLDVIISVGYRVHSQQGTKFRIWATRVLREYLLRGYAVNPQLQKVEYHLSRQIADQSDRIHALEQKVQDQQQQVDFLVNIHQQPSEELFATGCMWDAYSFIANLIRTAETSVVLVDNYCNDKTLTMLDERKKDVKAIVHTTYNKAFEEALEAHNSQRPQIDFIQFPHKEHDRFLIIDNDVYLLGNSLKDMGHTLSAAIKTGFSPEDVLSKLI